MPEQIAEEGQSVLKEAVQDSQIRRIHMRSIEARLQGEIDELKDGRLIPKAAQKAAMLEAAKALVSKVKCELEKEHKRFEMEIGGEDVQST